ncbi:MAG TPA: monovalent cation/H+ antiporter complex subunit F [Acidiferrobacterales bacterium]|jgi:multicomponent Na+:H+ antiporter subunit F
MFVAAGAAILVAILLFLVRALLGPTTYDRILAVNGLGTKAVIFVALLGFINGRPEFLDIALLYALINFIATVAILKYVEYRRLG